MMAGNNIYYHIVTAATGLCSWDREYLAQIKGKELCPECSSVLRDWAGAVDVVLKHVEALEKPLTAMGHGYPGLIWHELLVLLPAEIVERELMIGKVFSSNRTEVKGWNTYRARRRTIARGTHDASYRICEACGRYIYFATGKSYLFPSPPADALLLESDVSGLVMPEALFRRIDLGKWRKKVHIEKLAVVDSPADGLGVLDIC